MKGKVRLLVVILILALLAAGCWSRREIEDLAIIGAVAVDKANEENQVQLTLMITNPQAAAGGQQGGGQRMPALLVSAQGDNMADAARNISKNLPQSIFWSHSRLILIGEELAQAGVRIMDFISRDRQARLTSWVMVAEGRAADLLKVKPGLEKTPSERLAAMNRTKISLEVKLFEFLEMLTSEGNSPVLPRVEMRQTAPGVPDFILSGVALFRQEKLVGWMDERTARGLLWLRGVDITGGIITIPGVDNSREFLSVRVRDNSRQVEVLPREEGGIQLHVRLIADVDLLEVGGGSRLGNPDFIRNIEEKVGGEIAARGRQALAQARELAVEPFNFTNVVKRKQKNYWLAVKERWGEEFAENVPVVITTEINLRRTGLISNSLADR